MAKQGRMQVDDLIMLAELIRKKNEIDKAISVLIGRPAMFGHTGEYIASKVFDIKLNISASQKGIDGVFQSGELAGATVNVKWYTRQEGLLDINPDGLPDYYLVLTGPRSPAASSRGAVKPWLIRQVFIFDARMLVAAVAKRGVKIGIATSVNKELWKKAKVYPESNNHLFILSDGQRKMVSLFDQE